VVAAASLAAALLAASLFATTLLAALNLTTLWGTTAWFASTATTVVTECLSCRGAGDDHRNQQTSKQYNLTLHGKKLLKTGS
jgi:hypothetical protein